MTANQKSRCTLLDSFLQTIGFKTLIRKSPVSTDPIVIWVSFFVFIDVFMLQIIKELNGYTATYLYNPSWLISPSFAILAALGTSYLYKRYDTALDLIHISSRTSDPEQFDNIIPNQIRIIFYTIGIVYIYWTGYNIGIDSMIKTGGIAEVIGTLIIAPLGYVPIFVEFLSIYVGIMVFLPRSIQQSDFKLHFLDPEGLGGLRPIGELIKLAYYCMVVGLIGFLVFTYGPFILGETVQTNYPRPGLIINTAFSTLWILTVGTLAHGLYRLHLFLKRGRERELARLDQKTRELVRDPFDPHNWEIQDEEEFQKIRSRIQYVESTREYPTTFAMWSQILVGIILPKAIQLALTI